MKPIPAVAAAGACAAALVTFASSWSQVTLLPTPGAVEGRVTSSEGGPVELAQVVLADLHRGTATDSAGRFVLRAVPAGRVTLKILALGHPPLVQGVDVPSGGTARLDLVVGDAKTVATVPTIVVTAHRDRVDPTRTDSWHSLGRAAVKETPVDGLEKMLGLISGIVAHGKELHVQGGRGDEVQRRINGIEAVDAQRGSGADVASIAIQEVEVITGGMSAKDGGALSGVVDVTTREGGDSLGGELRWDTDRFGDPTKTFDRFDRIAVAIGGPGPVRNLTFFAAYEGTFSDPYPRSLKTLPGRTVLDFIHLGNRQSNEIKTSVKLAYRPSVTDKLTLESIVNRTIETPYDHMWSRKGFVQLRYDTVTVAGRGVELVPRYGSWSELPLDSTSVPMNLSDHTPTADDRFRQITGVWLHQLSPQTAWTTRLASLEFDDRRSVGRLEPWEYDTQAPFYWSGNSGPGTENNPYFVTHGDFPRYERHRTSTLSLKSDLSSQRRQNRVQMGVEAHDHRLQNLSLVQPNQESDGLPGASRSDYANEQPEGSAYAQDRWEYEGMLLNAGLRYDAFSPGDQVPSSDLPSGRRFKQQLSPRVGIAYPISVRDVMSFHYGWTYQTPQRGFLFENRGLNANVNIRGNPDLEPETNVAYQAALQHQFSPDLFGQFSVFFRDIFGLISARQEKDAYGNVVNVYSNGDYASARGLEASLTRRMSSRFSADVNYTYSLATGVASDPNEALLFFNGGRRYLPIGEGPLNWDQRHTFSLRSTIREPGRWGLRLLWTYGSGFPFTPTFRDDRRPDPRLANSRRLPSVSTLSVDLDQYFRIWGRAMTFYVDARNVLDAVNIIDLTPNDAAIFNPNLNATGDDYVAYYSETGRAGGAYLQDLNGDGIPEWVPVRDPRVFGEGRQVRLGIAMEF